MSARQPFLPSRPASRALNSVDDAGMTRVASSSLPSDTNDSAELGKTARALNITAFKKSAQRTSSFGAAPAPEFETAQNQNQNQNSSHSNAGGGPRSAAPKGAATGRIYAPHPSAPPAGVPIFDFKKPSLPGSLASRSSEEGTRGPNNNLNSNVHISPSADVVRPKSVRPPGSESGGLGRPGRASEQSSFFGNAKFGFDSSAVGGELLDDSGYFSEHADAEAPSDRFGSVKRNDANLDTRFAHSTKRGRPASPGSDQDRDVAIAMQQSNRQRDSDSTKRPCVRRSSPFRSRAPAMPENAPNERAPAFALPPHIPHPTAAFGELPGLEFSEADLRRYAELFEQGSERWSKASTEEWLAGADEILAKFGEMIDLIKDHMSSKMNLYKSLHARVSDEQSALDHRAKELRDASQSLVRDSGTLGGSL